MVVRWTVQDNLSSSKYIVIWYNFLSANTGLDDGGLVWAVEASPSVPSLSSDFNGRKQCRFRSPLIHLTRPLHNWNGLFVISSSMGLFGTFVFRPFFLPRVRTPLTHRRPTVRAVNDSFYTSSACVSWVFICLLLLFFPLFDYPPSYLHTHTHERALFFS